MDWENGYRKGIELALAVARRLVDYPEDVDEVLNILKFRIQKEHRKTDGVAG